jgi:hypothetical protein
MMAKYELVSVLEVSVNTRVRKRLVLEAVEAEMRRRRLYSMRASESNNQDMVGVVSVGRFLTSQRVLVVR